MVGGHLGEGGGPHPPVASGVELTSDRLGQVRTRGQEGKKAGHSPRASFISPGLLMLCLCVP